MNFVGLILSNSSAFIWPLPPAGSVCGEGRRVLLRLMCVSIRQVQFSTSDEVKHLCFI